MNLGLTFENVDQSSQSYRFTLSIGTDSRVIAASNFPTQGLRQLEQVTKLNNGICKIE